MTLLKVEAYMEPNHRKTLESSIADQFDQLLPRIEEELHNHHREFLRYPHRGSRTNISTSRVRHHNFSNTILGALEQGHG